MTKNEEVKKIISDYYSNHGNYFGISIYFKSNYKDLYDFVIDYTKILDSKYTLAHRLYWVINNIIDFPLCPNCGKQNKRKIDLERGYNGNLKYCCLHCVKTNSEYLERVKQTCLEKYGVDNPAKSREIQNKIDQTNVELYGVKRASQLQEFKDRASEICLERYGVDNASKSKEIIQRRNQTNIKKYGYISPLQNKEIHAKSIATLQVKYGVPVCTQNKDIMDKVKKTVIEKYGTECVFQSRWFLNYHRKFYQEKAYERLKDNQYVELLTSKEDFLNLKNTSPNRWRCKKCGEIFEQVKNVNNTPEDICVRCPKCFPAGYFRSYAEKEIIDVIKSIDSEIDIKYSDRTLLGNKELDIYIPSKSLAIEYDGLYWHSFHKVNRNKRYHLDKTELCLDKNIKLIHIFEDEWIYKRNIVISKLNNLLGKSNRILYARKCIIKELDQKTTQNFLINNHLQGSCNSKYNYGLYYNDELVSIMTFGNLRRSLGSSSECNTYELLRYCCLLNTIVIGAASKLFKYFIKNVSPSKIISYCDRRWSTGNLYYKLGFTLDHISDPNYWYIINDRREHRFGWRKDILKEKLKEFDPNLTEYENMFLNGYDCIYDCGNLVFEWKA